MYKKLNIFLNKRVILRGVPFFIGENWIGTNGWNGTSRPLTGETESLFLISWKVWKVQRRRLIRQIPTHVVYPENGCKVDLDASCRGAQSHFSGAAPLTRLVVEPGPLPSSPSSLNLNPYMNHEFIVFSPTVRSHTDVCGTTPNMLKSYSGLMQQEEGSVSQKGGFQSFVDS